MPHAGRCKTPSPATSTCPCRRPARHHAADGHPGGRLPAYLHPCPGLHVLSWLRTGHNNVSSPATSWGAGAWPLRLFLRGRTLHVLLSCISTHSEFPPLETQGHSQQFQPALHSSQYDQRFFTASRYHCTSVLSAGIGFTSPPRCISSTHPLETLPEVLPSGCSSEQFSANRALSPPLAHTICCNLPSQVVMEGVMTCCLPQRWLQVGPRGEGAWAEPCDQRGRVSRKRTRKGLHIQAGVQRKREQSRGSAGALGLSAWGGA